MPSGEGKDIDLFVSLCYHFIRGDNYDEKKEKYYLESVKRRDTRKG